MLITEDFVLLNFPKTGSSFTREAIKRCYRQSDSRAKRTLENIGILKPQVKELILPKIDEIHHSEVRDQHGTWRQIPPKFRGRRIVSITREPVSRYLSAYRFGWWKQFPPGDLGEIMLRYPAFPDLSFQQYYEMTNDFALPNRLKGITPKIDLGVHTVQFIQFFFRDPEKTLREIDHDYIDNKRYLGDMADIHFLEQTNLRSDLKDFLLSIGKNAVDLKFLDEMKEVNTTDKRDGAKREKDIACDEVVVGDILSRDRLIYTIFPHYRTDGP